MLQTGHAETCDPRNHHRMIRIGLHALDGWGNPSRHLGGVDGVAS